METRHCVVKDTLIEIDSSETSADEVFMTNALNSGFAKNEVEILTKEEYLARRELEPKPIIEPSIEERVKTTEETIMMLLMGGI